VEDERDKEARRRRAARLRDQINTVLGKTGDGSPRRVVPRVESLSPRDAIRRRMRELDRASDNKADNKKDC
jgi:hypothetical protein